ncbi:hypothetical protein ACVW07_003952 [Cellulomonas sp. URHB0016]
MSSATASSSAPVALMPGNSSAIVLVTTPVSPSEGSTWSMYRRNVRLGPTSSTPERSRVLRCA